MQTLRVDVSGRALSFPPDRPVRIGRSIDADVVVAATAVSRAHAELRPGPGGWHLVDVGSSGGTFVEGRPVKDIPLTAATTVHLGPPEGGAAITVTPEEHVAADAPPAQAPAPPPPPTGVHPAFPAPAPAASPAPPPAPPASATPAAPSHPSVHPVHPVQPVQPVQPEAAGGVPNATPPAADAPSDAGAPMAVDPADVTIAPGVVRPGSPGEPQQPVTGPDLLIVAEGREHRFRHPVTVTIGRAEDNSVVIADQGVSRHHARLVAKPGGWVFENASQAGSFRKGEPLRSEAIDEESEIRLGHPVAGEVLKVIPVYSAEVEIARAAKKKRNKMLMWGGIGAAAAIVVAALVIGLVVVGIGGNKSGAVADGLSKSALHRDEAAVVFITYFPDKETLSMGSGTIVDRHGVILTNAHVADPAALGDGEPSPEFVYVHLTKPAQGYTVGQPDYRAKVVKSDPKVDSAAIQIYAKADGTPVDPKSLDLPTITIGDSETVQEGDDVTVLGFPGIVKNAYAQGDINAFLQPPSVTTGTIATILNVGGEKRSVYDITARVAHGNSGGAMVNDEGQLIGVPTWAFNNAETGDQSFQGTPVARHEPVLSAAGVSVPGN